MTAAYVYALVGTPEVLRIRLEALGQPLFHWAADEGGLRMGQGAPSDWRDQGATFGPKGELRWWREGETFRALLLVDEPQPDLSPSLGEWSAVDQEFDLQNLRDMRIHPDFDQYPHNRHRGRMSTRIFYRNGVPVFISLRALKEGEKER